MTFAGVEDEVGDAATRVLNHRLAIAEGTVEKLEADIELISDALEQEAADRGWCEEYDRFIEHLNTKLHKPLRLREREHLGTITLSVKFVCHPDFEEQTLRDIARALYDHGDDLGGENYTITEAGL